MKKLRTKPLNHAAQYFALAATFLLPLAALPSPSLGADSAGPKILSSGPVHAALVSANTRAIESTARVPRQPPTEPLAANQPTRQNLDLVWIDGYWEWHRGYSEFVWVPGIWRKAPSGLTWKPGKWMPAPDGAVRYPGYWFKNSEPPEILRNSPADKPADDPDYKRDGGRTATRKMVGNDGFWVRGGWTLDAQGRYKWKPGYVAAVQEGYQWQAGSVIPVPGGYVVVDGYWDYPIPQRGQAFAALRLPSAPQAESPQSQLSAIDLPSIVQSPGGEWLYTRLHNSNQAILTETLASEALVAPFPRPLDRGLAFDGQGAIQGVVRKGKLTPHSIEIKLMGGAARVTESDDQGRFAFKDIPYGTYTLLAEGPVQNYFRQGAAVIDVEQPVVKVEIELE